MIKEHRERFHSFATDSQTVIAMSTSAIGKPACHPVSESAMLIAPFPQFAALMTEVPALAKDFGYRFKFVEIPDQLGAPLVVLR